MRRHDIACEGVGGPPLRCPRISKLEYADDLGALNKNASEASLRLSALAQGGYAEAGLEISLKKTKAMPRYAGPRVLGYLYVGPGHVVKDLKGSLQVPLALRCAAACALRVYACTLHACCMYAIHTLQPGNVTERECATHCTANPKCKGFAWCAQAEALP